MPASATSQAQLVEFVAATSSSRSEAEVVGAAAELAATTIDAEVALLLDGEEVLSSTGWAPGADVGPLVRALGTCGSATVDLQDLGPVTALAMPVPSLGPGGQLVVARLDDGFEPAERALVMGMARLLGVSVDAARALEGERDARAEVEATAGERLRLLAALREREMLLTTLLEVQRAISHRRPLEEVLDLVARGTSASLGDVPVALVLQSGPAGDRLGVVASTHPALTATTGDDLVALAARAVTAPGTSSERVGGEVRLAAPVHLQGRALGALLARVAPADVEAAEGLLAAFAAHASIALGDADTAAITRQAFYDQLTRLPNRALLLDRLERALARRDATGRSTALLFVDLDRFKQVNDRYGHAVGDRVLAECAARVEGCLRADDTAARLGGDEFAVLLEDVTSEGHAVEVAERLVHAVSAPLRSLGIELGVGASVGVALAADGAGDAHALLGEADLAMYRAKAEGGGAVVVFHPSMHAERTDRLALEADLARAVDREELVLHYQPVVDLRDGRVLGAEALVRWQHPVRGLLGPDVFVPVAEATGDIAAVGRWVLREACRAAVRWRVTAPSATVAVNVSPRQVADPGFVALVRDALRDARLPPEALVLEITESMLLPGGAPVLQRLEELAHADVSVAVDDFGTGYSSLSSLRRLPVDELKVDRSFVRDMGDREGLAVVRAVLDLARALGLRCVAEGVEHAEEAALLARLGCERAQGYYFSRPLPEGALLEMLAERAAAPRPAPVPVPRQPRRRPARAERRDPAGAPRG
ncbi:EAL domain-containing protein [uncultured Pseudokineococcus sp.]|uniref:putative bifunctional diguanylate cyclase/phosphodiesterase n=1 Tax=uncultured Pseudokineococcus sp. TaxID=1642928 RepID=UPI002636CD53|nr:EAL domain-containing protein [uncultured Pseudokineococcus sp.]